MGDGRTKKATRNIAYNVGNQVWTLVLTFVSRTVFINYLGAEFLGISGLFNDVLNMLSLADLGFNSAMIYSLYQPLKDNDQKKIAALITLYRQIYTVVALTVAIIGTIIIPLLPYMVNLEREVPHLTAYYLMSLANVVLSYLCVYKTSILYADQKQYKTTGVTMIVGTVRTVLQIVAIILFKSYMVYLALGCVGAVLTNLIASLVATKEYPYIHQRVSLDKGERTGIFKNLGSVFIYKLSTVLITATDNMLISVIVGTLFVGYYSNYLLLQNKIAMFYVLIFTSLTASIGNLIVSEKAEKRYLVFECEQSVSYIICGVVIPCYTLLINDFIRLWLGTEYMLSFGAVLAVGLNMYLTCVLQPLWSFREATGLYRKTKWIMLICAVFNIVLSVVLGKLIGITGILLATSIAKFSTYIWYEPKLLFNEYFKKKPTSYYLSMVTNALLIAVTVLIGSILSGYVDIKSWWMWIVKAIVIGLLSGLVVIACYAKSPGIKKFKEIMLRVFSAKRPKENKLDV